MEGMRRLLGLVGVLAGELAVAGVLHRLGELPWLRVGWDDPAGWLAAVAPEDAVMAALRLVALAGTYWLVATTVAYALARASRLPGAIRSVRWATLPAVRGVVDRAVAATIAGSVVVGTVGTHGLAVAAVTLPPALTAPADLPGDPARAGGPADRFGGPGDRPGDPAGGGPADRFGGPGDRPGDSAGAVGRAPALTAPAGLPRDPAGDPPEASGDAHSAPAAPAQEQLADPPRAHTVVPGDNLWAITASHLGPGTSDAEIYEPWRDVVDANRERLRSGDPDLIYPGEQVLLPPAVDELGPADEA